ncbi:hypothetical protein [Flexithrix dorotheae]|uniref:hypothetical protein n=1 Tax=Flexithrix dorotheae TaxID=70993 RepID=UPI00037F027A|nr:hypothetical protein [Flexithrix dorotheae]
MAFFDRIFKRLFSESIILPDQEPIITEALKRRAKELSNYFYWLNNALYKSLLSRIQTAYWEKQRNRLSDLQIHLFNTRYANGLAITYHPSISPEEFQHFFDLLKDRALNIGYNLSISDRKIFDRKKYVEVIEKYYLKPPLSIPKAGEIKDQMYGNILIEQVLIDSNPSYIKLMANIYSDRLYTKAKNFDKLIKELFSI